MMVRDGNVERTRLLHGRCDPSASAFERAGVEHLDPGRFQSRLEACPCAEGQGRPEAARTYTAERAPVAKQIVTRASKSIEEFGPIFKALGLLDFIVR